ncbi:hypothetical protein ABZS79_35410 [Streptomyces griseoloalbus]|uniref:hypothetical protein n=1 Tax=Streptomyces griseoloalbus TaxID=67303 RepID=UPI00339EDBD6
MSELLAKASGQVHADYHAFHLANSGEYVQPPFHPENGLVFSRPGLAVVLTGVNSGPVRVTVEVYRRAVPPPGPDEAWDEVVDHSVQSISGDMRVVALMDTCPELPVLTPFGPADYRIRVHARGRDQGPDAHVTEPVEDYLLQVWPGRREPDLVHRQNDRYGQISRDAVQGQPEQAAPPAPPGDDWKRAARARLNRRNT